MRSPKYLLLITGWYRRFWWRVEQPEINCTADERESVLPSFLAISQLGFVDETGDHNDVLTTPGIVSHNRLIGSIIIIILITDY